MDAQAKASAEQSAKEQASLVVEPGILWRGQLPVVAFAGLYAVLLYAVLFFPLAGSVAAEPDFGVQAILRAQVMEVHLRVWPLLVVALLAASSLAFYHSLRVARPVYRVHYALREIVEGDYKPAPFPRREEFRFLQDDLIQLSQKMKLIAARNRDILLIVNAQMEKLAARLEAGEVIPRADLEESVGIIRAQLQKAPEVTLARR